MCWMCDHPGSAVDDYLDVLRAKMGECGWAAQYVEDRRMPYAYTIGLTNNGLPEIVVVGVYPHRERFEC